MKSRKADSSWLPPREEWDFRGVTSDECRIACWWEYARSIPSIAGDVNEWADRGKGLDSGFVNVVWDVRLFHHGMRFPAPWLTLPKGQRSFHASRMSVAPLTFMPIIELTESLKLEVKAALDAGKDGDPLKVIDDLLAGDGKRRAYSQFNEPLPQNYFVRVNFSAAGSEAVVAALTAWAREQAKKFPRRKSAKAAEPPFACLRWLSAWRLDLVRRPAHVSFDDVKFLLAEHERKFPVVNSSPVLPDYSSHGAWSKAKGDAQALRELFETDPKAFEKRLAVF